MVIDEWPNFKYNLNRLEHPGSTFEVLDVSLKDGEGVHVSLFDTSLQKFYILRTGDGLITLVKTE